MKNTREELLDELEDEFRAAPSGAGSPARSASLGKRAFVAVAALAAGVGFFAMPGMAGVAQAGENPKSSDVHALGCTDPDFIPRTHTKWCGAGAQDFHYLRTEKVDQTTCYVFDWYTWTCSSGYPRFMGEKSACM
jgi:hypothetical protein